MTMSLANLRWWSLICLLSAFAVSTARAEESGQEDLDKAIAAKLSAESLEELTEVVELCQSALDRGLEKDSTTFAKQLLASTLLQRAEIIIQALQNSAPTDASGLERFLRLRQLALADLERSLRHDNSQAETHFQIGRLHTLPGGDRKRAMAALDQAIKLPHDDATIRAKALLLRATLHQDAKLRLADCNAAVDAAPDSAEALRARGTLYLELNQAKEALADLDASLKLDPKHAPTLEVHGLAHAMLEQYEQALKSLTSAIELEPKSPFAYLHRARVHLAQDHAQEAVEDLTEVLALEVASPTVLLLRAGAYQQLKQVDKALADVENALKLRPGLVPALRARAMLHAADNKFDLAATDLQEVLKADPNDTQVLVQLGLVYGAGKHLAEAIDMFTTAIDLDDKKTMAYQGRADVYLRQGKHAAAVADYKRVLQDEPKNSHVLNNLAWTLATSPDEKLRDGKKAIELATAGCEQTEYKQAHLVSTLAAGYAETGDFESAIRWSKKAVELSEDDIKVNLEKELASYMAGKPWRERQTEEELHPQPQGDAEKTATRPGEIK